MVYNLVAQLNAGTVARGIVIITLLVVLVGDLIVGRSSSLDSCHSDHRLLAPSLPTAFQWDTAIPSRFSVPLIA